MTKAGGGAPRMMSQHDHEWQIENTRQGLEYAREGLRTLVLINGGAIIALLALLGSYAEAAKEKLDLKFEPLRYALMIYAVGLLFAALTFVAAYICQLYFAENNQTGLHLRTATWYRVGALALVVGLIGSFLIATYLAAGAVVP